MFNDLLGKRVLITGSTAGIGLAAAKAFAAQGATVAINGRHDTQREELEAALNQTQGSGKLFVADVAQAQDCQQLVDAVVEEFGGLDILINNAGGLLQRQGLATTDLELYDNMQTLNMRSVLLITQAAMPHLSAAAKARGETAAVITTGSIAAHQGGGPGAGLYAGAKAWLLNIHRQWVKEFSAQNVRFNIVSPGTVDTAFHADKTPAMKAKICEEIPLGRLAQAEDIAASYLFLASHQCAAYITGQSLEVNGGQWCR